MSATALSPTPEALPKSIPVSCPGPPVAPTIDEPTSSLELAADLNWLERVERIDRDRQQESEVARLRDLARFD